MAGNVLAILLGDDDGLFLLRLDIVIGAKIERVLGWRDGEVVVIFLPSDLFASCHTAAHDVSPLFLLFFMLLEAPLTLNPENAEFGR